MINQAGLTRKVIVQQLPERRFKKKTLGSSLLSTEPDMHARICQQVLFTSVRTCTSTSLENPTQAEIKDDVPFGKEPKNWLLNCSADLYLVTQILLSQWLSLGFKNN
jgi:hypothetical protein